MLLSLWVLVAGPAAANPGPAPSLAQALNPDGTLRTGAQGSFNARHFTMTTAPDGRPSFHPAGARSVTGVGDDKWQDGFGLPGLNGSVNAVVQVGTDTYVGGYFTVIGNLQANYIAKWNGTTWSSLGTGTANGVNSSVLALAVSGTDVYVGGNFTQAGGVVANKVARWNGTSWSSLGTGTENGVSGGSFPTVQALAASGTNVYVGGDFAQAGSTTATNVARWNGTAWSSLGTGAANGVNASVAALAANSTNLYVGGGFTQAGGVAAGYVARWNVGTATWNQLGTGVANGTVRSVAVSGSNVYFGGGFSSAGGVSALGIARWDGAAWSALGTGPSNGGSFNRTVRSVAAFGSMVYAGGEFNASGGALGSAVGNYVAQWNGISWSGMGSGAANGTNNYVQALAASSAGVVAGGQFTQAGGAAANYIANWSGTAWSPLPVGTANGTEGLLNVVAVAGTDVYVGGTFTQVGTVSANRVAKWNGTAWSSLGTGAANGIGGGQVHALAVIGTDVYVGGNIAQAGGVTTYGIAKWNGTTWSSVGTGLGNSSGGSGTVYALAAVGNDLYAGGQFMTAGGAAASNVARWDGTTWYPLIANGLNGLSSTVWALAASGNALYLGGEFTTAGGNQFPPVTLNRVAKWDGTAWASLGTGAANGIPSGTVYALAVSGTDVYVGGFFYTAGGVSASCVARWNGTTWNGLGTGISNGGSLPYVYALALDGSNLYVGGDFTVAGGAPASRVAKWNGTAWTTLGTGLNNTVRALGRASGSQIYAGGGFLKVGDGSKITAGFGKYDGAAPAPTLASISPNTATLNSAPFTITVTGTDFLPGATVRFAGRLLATTYVSATELTAGVITSDVDTVGTFRVVVITPGGTSSFQSFTVTPSVAPAISGLNPTSGSVGTSVTISGTNLANATGVSFNGTVVSSNGFTSNTASQLVVSVPTGASTGNVTVTTADGTSNGVSFTVTGQPATLASISPGSGMVGDSVIITGTNFNLMAPVGTGNSSSMPSARLTAVTEVRFNGLLANFTITSPSRIRAFVPAGATSGPITVTTSTGTLTSTYFVVVRDLTVSTGTLAAPVAVPADVYRNLLVTGTGVAQLTGAIEVQGSVSVQNGGVLLTDCQPLTGAGSFAVAAGATLGICDAAGLSTTAATGAVQTTGTRSFSTDATYLYNGIVAQATGDALPAQVRELNVSTTGGNLTLTNDLAIGQVVRITTPDFNYGNLDLGGHALTLRSSSAGTALLVNAGNGSVLANTGTCRMERYIEPGLNPGAGYRHFSSPIPTMTIGQLATTGFTPVLTQAYNTSATPNTTTPFPNVFGYDQTRLTSAANSNLADFDKGWVVPTGTTAMAQATGYTVNVPAAAVVTFSGASFNQAQGGRFMSPGRGPQADAGWALVGNPFPSPIDLSVPNSQSRINLDGANYVFESTSQYGGQYRSYLNGIGNPLVAAGQGFFVRMNLAGQNSAISFARSSRITSYGTQVPFRRNAADSRPLVALRLQARGLSDEAHVYAETGATAGVDAQFDAVKMMNTSGLNLATLATTGEQLAIQGLPAIATGTVLPLTLELPGAGATSFTATVANLPAGLTAFLTDALTGTRQDLSAQPTYSFVAAQAGTVTGRFALVFGPAAGALATTKGQASIMALYPNPARTAATLALPAAAQARPVQLVDGLGRVVRHATLPASAGVLTLDLSGLPAGVYAVRCGTALARLVVE